LTVEVFISASRGGSGVLEEKYREYRAAAANHEATLTSELTKK
jgi:hypothetical protein